MSPWTKTDDEGCYHLGSGSTRPSGVVGLGKTAARKIGQVAVDLNARALDGLSQLLHMLLERGNRRAREQREIKNCTTPLPEVFERVKVLRRSIQGLSEVVAERRAHENSLAGYGADHTAPAASADAGTSADGDTVRDVTDTSSPPGAGRAE